MTDTNTQPSRAAASTEDLAGVIDGATTPVPTRALLGRGVRAACDSNLGQTRDGLSGIA